MHHISRWISQGVANRKLQLKLSENGCHGLEDDVQVAVLAGSKVSKERQTETGTHIHTCKLTVAVKDQIQQVRLHRHPPYLTFCTVCCMH